jgi:hypothetical protein
MNTTIILLIVFMVVIALVGLIAILVRRKQNSFELIIARDNRRNSMLNGKTKYNLRYGTLGSLKAIKIYNHLISILPVRTLTEIADPRPFLWYGRTVVGVIGPTGTPEDDSIILIKPPMLTDIDIQRDAAQQQEAIAGAFTTFSPTKDKPFDKQVQDFVKDKFTKEWVTKTLGPHNLIDKNDVIPRSQKVAYTSEIEHAEALKANHQGAWAKLAAMAPAILVVIMIIGAGIFFYEMYNAQGQYLTSLTQDEGMLTSYAQSMSLSIGNALAKVGVYGYNATLPGAPSLRSNTSILPSLPKT